MDGKKTAIWILAIFLFVALGVIFLQTMRFRKAKTQLSTPATLLANYIATLPVYTTNADAVANGLAVGTNYKVSSTATTFLTVQ